MPTPFIDILHTVFPVIALDPELAGQMARPDFFGTAFAVAPGVFMTAAHVVKAASEHGKLGLAGPGQEQPMMGAVQVDHVETWPERDVALLFTAAPGVALLDSWLVKRVQVLTDLSSFGSLTQSAGAPKATD